MGFWLQSEGSHFIFNPNSSSIPSLAPTRSTEQQVPLAHSSPGPALTQHTKVQSGRGSAMVILEFEQNEAAVLTHAV